MKKVVVAHFAQQHSLQTAVAIDKIGCLDKYITTLYDKDHNLLSFAKRLLKGNDVSKINKKRDDRLDDQKVIQFCESQALLLKGINRLGESSTSKWLQRMTRESLIHRFDTKVGDYITNENIDAVVLYDTYALQTMQIVKNKSPKTIVILDMSAPYIGEIDNILRNENNIYHYPDLEKELEDKLYLNCLKRGKEEIKIADYFLVASEFTRESLVKHGVDEKCIFICPYGMHETYDIYKLNNNTSDGSFKCMFVGNVNSKKGIQCFLDVAKCLYRKGFSFTIVGDVDKTSSYFI